MNWVKFFIKLTRRLYKLNEIERKRERLYGKGDLLKQRIYEGDTSMKTLKEFADILDQLEELRVHSTPLHKVLVVDPIA